MELPSWLSELLGQGVHAVLPSDSLKVFDGQFEHEPRSPVVPAGQTSLQSDSSSLPNPDIVSPEHGVQLAPDGVSSSSEDLQIPEIRVAASRGYTVHCHFLTYRLNPAPCSVAGWANVASIKVPV